MQEIINIEELSDTEYKINIQVSPEDVDKKFDEFFKGIKKNTQIPGFRKGKAPVSRLKQLYGQKVRPSISQLLIDEYYAKALQDHNINPIDNPTFESDKIGLKYNGKFGFDNSYSVSLLVEVLPKIDPVGYKGLELDFPIHNESDLFDDKMNEYREQFAERKQITDRSAKLGDTLVLDFVGSIEDKPFDGGAAKGFTVDKLGQGHFIPGFEEQVVGMNVGETKCINATFPSEYRASHLAGKEAKFQTTVQSIIEVKLAEVNEDLAMMVGYESVDKLTDHIKDSLKNEIKMRDRQIMDQQINIKLLEINKFNAPKSMVSKEKLRLLGKMKVNGLPEKAKDELQIMAEQNIKQAIIIDAIYEKEEDIEVTPDQLSDRLEEHAAKNKQTKDELVSDLYNTNQMDNFVGVLRTANVVNFIISNSKKESEKDNDRSSDE